MASSNIPTSQLPCGGKLFVASSIVRFRYGPPVRSPSWLTGPGWSLAPAKPTMAFYIPARRHRVTPIPVGHATAPNQELRRRDFHPLVQQPDSPRALDVATGKVTGQMVQRHRSEEFLAFLELVSEGIEPGTQVHVILDNVSSHKSAEVNEWLKDNPNWTFHFTPTSASWMNAVEGFFSKLLRQ